VTGDEGGPAAGGHSRMEECSLIVGLGNPGDRYAQTRHNAGFLAIDRLAEQIGAPWVYEKRFDSQVARGVVGNRPVFLVKPQTYMNASGEAVGGLVQFFRIPLSGVLVLVDDADLPLGTIRLRPAGSSGGHHGLESIASHLGGQTGFARLRVGIGRVEPERRELTGHVLGPFDRAEWPLLKKVLDRVAEQAVCWLVSGVEQAMNQYNGALERPPA